MFLRILTLSCVLLLTTVSLSLATTASSECTTAGLIGTTVSLIRFKLQKFKKFTRTNPNWRININAPLEFYERTVALKSAAGSRVKKVFLAIGGWNDSLGPKYSNMVMSKSKR